MDFRQALERNLSLKTEYGGGGRVARGLVRRRVFRRQNYKLDGTRTQDTIHELMLRLGPVRVIRRSHSPALFSDDNHEIAVSLFKLFAVYSNDKDVLIKVKTGAQMRVLRDLLGFNPATRAVSHAVDLDAAARAGLRLNITRLLNDIKRGDEELPGDEPQDADIDFS